MHPRLRFLHIPKTAGTTFFNCLKRVYRANRFRKNAFVFTGDLDRDVERYRKLDAAVRSNIVLVSGHAPLITGEADLDQLPAITFLRDPVERVKSVCQHFSEGKVDYVSPETMDLDALLAGDDFWLHNQQARLLLGVGRYELPEGSEDVLVEKAIDVLENRMAAFGLTEHFDESLLLFRQVLGWRNDPVYVRLNEKNRGRELRFSDMQLRRIREVNELDIKIYEAAKRIFEARLKASPEAAGPRRTGFILRQQLFGPFLGMYKLYHKAQLLMVHRHRKSRRP